MFRIGHRIVGWNRSGLVHQPRWRRAASGVLLLRSRSGTQGNLSFGERYQPRLPLSAWMAQDAHPSVVWHGFRGVAKFMGKRHGRPTARHAYRSSGASELINISSFVHSVRSFGSLAPPSFSPYRHGSTGSHPYRAQNPTRHSSNNSPGISPRNREGRWTRWSILPFGQIDGYRK